MASWSGRKSRVKAQKQERMLVMIVFLALGFLIVFGQLFKLQILYANEGQASQVDQLVEEDTVIAERGNIYDRNMNILVEDSSAKEVNVIPLSVEDPELLATGLSNSLGLDYNETLAKISVLEDNKVQLSSNTATKDVATLTEKLANPDAYLAENGCFYVTPDKVVNLEQDINYISSYLDMDPDEVRDYLTKKENSQILIKSKVDNAQAEAVEQAVSIRDENGEIVSSNGVELISDKKRYYTNGNFASYVLGFTSNEHEGLYGVEKTFDSKLRGTDGKVYNQRDAKGNIIPSQTTVIQESQRGEDLVLSIDSNIQTAAEKALKSCIDSWEAKSGTAIVMDVDTGEVLAMATMPDFDLNDPYKIPEYYKGKHADELEDLPKEQQLEQMWKNQAVSFIYEPGSTFKPITVATALEEGAIDPTLTFNCTGAITIGETTINCTGVHGVQTISETLENSCNPGLVQIISRVDPQVFYKYAYNCGFGQQTGIELTGEESGIVNRTFDDEGNIRMVDYSTFSFGQGLATTPIQLVTALDATINNGYYVKPTIVKGGSSESPKQVFSSSTSSEMRKDMEAVLNTKSDLHQMAGEYSMGGKTGTAQQFVNGTYESGVYVTSFFCFSPIDDPKYSCLVILDEPNADASGQTSAAPTAIEILRQTLAFSGSAEVDKNVQTNVVIPACVGNSLDSVKSLLEDRGIKYRIENQADGELITAQSIPAQTAYDGTSELVLTVGSVTTDTGATTMPDLNGMTVQRVNELLHQSGLKLKIEGTGFAYEQSVAPGEPIEAGQTITVKFKNE